MKTREFDGYLRQISGLFSIGGFLKQDTGPEAIRRGSVNSRVWSKRSWTHSERREKLLSASCKSAAEKGYNSLVLARSHREDRFCGLDLTSAHIDISRRKAARQQNLTFQVGDYHDLPFADGSFSTRNGKKARHFSGKSVAASLFLCAYTARYARRVARSIATKQ